MTDGYLQPLELASLRSEVVTRQLDMTCTIQRATAGAADPYGQPGQTWANHLVGIRCHYWESDEEELVGTPNATLTTERMVLPANTDVTNKDRITSLVGVDDQPIGGTFNILEVLAHETDTVLALRRVT